jgi:hypothetical protein
VPFLECPHQSLLNYGHQGTLAFHFILWFVIFKCIVNPTERNSRHDIWSECPR